MNDLRFDDMGKKMPYTVPEGFFDEAKRRARGIASAERRTSPLRAIAGWAVAASIAAAAVGTALYMAGARPDEQFAATAEARYADLLTSASTETLYEISANYMEETQFDL